MPGANFKLVRLIHINTEKTNRGGERQVIVLLKALLENNIEVTLLCREDYPLHHIAKKEGINTIATQKTTEIIKWLILNSNNYDIIHSHAAKAQGLAALSKYFTKKSHIYTKRTSFRPNNNIFTKKKYLLTDKVVCVTNTVKNVLLEYGLKSDRLLVIYDAVSEKKEINKKRAKDLLKELGIPEKAKIIGNIAALSTEKDHETIILAANKIDYAYFLIFGEGKMRAKLENMINSLGLKNRVFLVGHKDNVEDFFSVFDIFLFSSRTEGLGSVIIDAFLYHVPVITTAAGGVVEAVHNGYSGIVVDVGDYQSMTNTINYLLENEGIREKFTTNAYALAKERFSVDRMADEYINLYKTFI